MANETIPANDKDFISDILAYMKDQDVTLVASDGQVKTSMKLLKARSTVFRAMFQMKESKEWLNKTVDMSEYPVVSLQAFIQYLSNQNVVNGHDVGCDLLLLADYYDVPSLKTKAEDYLLRHMNDANAGKIYDVLFRVSPDRVKQVFIDKVTSRPAEEAEVQELEPPTEISCEACFLPFQDHEQYAHHCFLYCSRLERLLRRRDQAITVDCINCGETMTSLTQYKDHMKDEHGLLSIAKDWSPEGKGFKRPRH